MSRVALFLFFLAVSVSAKSYELTFQFTGGIPVCTQCGRSGQYACSSGVGKWNNGTVFFNDPLPVGEEYILTEVYVTLTGSYSCLSSSAVDVRVELDGTVVDEQEQSGSQLCKCNTCDGDSSIYENKIFYGGWPGYVYHGNNSLQVISKTPGNAICLNTITLNLTYSEYPALQYQNYLIPYLSQYPDSCSACAAVNHSRCTSSGDWNYGQASFKDIIPPGNIVVYASAIVYGKYLFSGTRVLTAALTGTNLGSIYVGGHGGSICTWCDGGLFFDQSEVYQAGWPGYTVGGWNTFTVSLDYSGYTYCIGFVELVVGYYGAGVQPTPNNILAINE